MKALLFERTIPRYAASRIASTLGGSGKGVKVGPLRLTDNASEPGIPGPDWQRLTVRLSGICGSDLATLDGHSSRYFEDIVSFPFVPGHEIVADNDEGQRVVVEPVLTCAARNVSPPCAPCSAGDTGCCTSLSLGHLAPGLQTGFCADTGGGWGRYLVAHASQVHPVPENFSDEDAVMVEPAACGVHAALAAKLTGGETVALLGAGTLGLVTLAALRRWSSPRTIVVGAKYPIQKEWAAKLGADLVVEPSEVLRAVRRVTGSMVAAPASATVSDSAPGLGPRRASAGSSRRRGAWSPGASASPRRLSGGADLVIDCVGNATSLDTALSVVRPRGKVLLVGMPGPVRIDLAPLWHREVSVAGAYAYGRETALDGSPRTFDLAFELVGEHSLGQLVSARYPLERHAEAVAHAAAAGPRGSVKIVFDPRRRR